MSVDSHDDFGHGDDDDGSIQPAYGALARDHRQLQELMPDDAEMNFDTVSYGASASSRALSFESSAQLRGHTFVREFSSSCCCSV